MCTSTTHLTINGICIARPSKLKQSDLIFLETDISLTPITVLSMIKMSHWLAMSKTSRSQQTRRSMLSISSLITLLTPTSDILEADIKSETIQVQLWDSLSWEINPFLLTKTILLIQPTTQKNCSQSQLVLMVVYGLFNTHHLQLEKMTPLRTTHCWNGKHKKTNGTKLTTLLLVPFQPITKSLQPL